MTTKLDSSASAPEFTGYPKQIGQFAESLRFDQVRICAEAISLFGVSFSSGAAEQDNR
jgi:hypothetical protein